MPFASLFLSCAAWGGVPAADADYVGAVAPFFAAYCNKCHDGAKPKGEFSLTAAKLTPDFRDAAAARKWREVVNVLNSHQMPPDGEKKPKADEVAVVVDWIVAETTRAELEKRQQRTVLRRLNRDEYRNTIRDLVGVDFDTSGFPLDPPAGGFDNNGGALTVSPLHLEMYLAAAQQILDKALMHGERPKPIRWRFEPRVGPIDRTRKRLDAKNNAIVNGSNNRQEGDWVVVHHNSWDKAIGARDFRVPHAGNYSVCIHAAGRTPTREQVVASAEGYLLKRRDDELAKRPDGAKWIGQAYERDLKHFQTDRMYDYGPPRIKLVQQLGPQPRVVAEFDVDATTEKPKTYSFTLPFTTESAGLCIEYAYDIPRVLENFWMQTGDKFARPELLVDWFEIEGPLYDSWPPSSFTTIVGSADREIDADRARSILERFMRRAYRRPVAAEEVARKLRLYVSAAKEKPPVEALKTALAAVLASPNFLYLVESSGEAPESRSAAALTPHQLATRLSYFLWSTMPDEALLRHAESGDLAKSDVMRRQVERMLADPKSSALVMNFAGQWLGLREVGANPPAADLFPQYDRHLELSIVRESLAYFEHFRRNDVDVRQMIRSDFVVVNERLARYYGIDDVRGDYFRRVDVPDGVHRGGIVTQASILTITSNGTRTSPVKRGTWILKTLLGTDPGLPVANVGEIAPKVPGIDKATVRQRLEIHRTLPQCARCHSRIDPLGFALENFNAAGEWRDREGFGYKGRIEPNDPKIDASSRMPDGTEIIGVAGLQQAMLAREEQFLVCLASKLMTYAYGRELGLADQAVVRKVVASAKSDGYSLRAMIHAIVASEPFQSK